MAVGIAGGFFLAYCFIFLWNLFRAPYFQRNEARGALASKETEFLQQIDEIESAPLTVEQKQHHDDLRELLARLKDADAYEWSVGASRGLYNLWFLGIEWPISIGKSKREPGGLTLITIPEENTLWPFLEKHLTGQKVLGDLEAWRQATVADIQKRCTVLEMGMRQVKQRLNYPIIESVDMHTSEGVSSRLLLDVFDLVVADVVFGKAIQLDERKFTDEGRPRELWFEHSWIATGAPEMLMNVRTFLRSAPDEIGKTEEATSLKNGYNDCREKAQTLKKAIEVLLLVHTLPRGSRCSQCP